jgi:hypothetical protein
MTTVTVPPSVQQRSYGRGYFWAGIGSCLLGMALVVAQFSLKYLFVPWYCPVLASLGAILLLVAVVRRRTIPRVAGLVLIAALAGFQWYALVWLMKLPEYEGPARAGKPMPAFNASFVNGQSFTDADLRDGSRHVLVFFRGRW